jgi:predicted exporter
MHTRRRRSRGRRSRLARTARKTFINLVFAPARIPRIRQDTVDTVMRLCEIAALTFVCMLVAHIAVPQVIKVGFVIVSGVIFAILLGIIKLSDYQEKIEQYRYYGFRI